MMPSTPQDSQFLPYYKKLLKEMIFQEIKKGSHQEILKEGYLIDQLHQQGYELEGDEVRYLEVWLQSVLKLSFLNPLMELQGACLDIPEEIIVHSPTWIQTIGHQRKEYFDQFLDDKDYQLTLELVAILNEQLWNEAHPFASFQIHFHDHLWRATLIHKSLTHAKNSKLFLRSQKKEHFSLHQFSLTEGQEHWLKEQMALKKNILVAGATGSGKTTFLRSLIDYLPEREHLIILEDTPEIETESPFCTRLVSQGVKGKTLKDYCHYSLRLRPDRIILGEIRSDEVVPFLLNINTGHGGMMASLHANSALDTLHRLCLLFQIYSGKKGIDYCEVLKLVCQGVDIIVFLENKKVMEMLEIKGSEGLTPYYQSWH